MRYLLILMLTVCSWTVSAKAQLSQAEYTLLTQAFKLIEEDKLSGAYQHLKQAQDQVRSDYAKALVAHNLGQVDLQRERYKGALGHLKKAYGFEALPPEQQVNLLHTLAQLSCMDDQWKNCINYMNSWMKQAPSKIKGEDYLLLAQANSELDRWSQVVRPIGKAIATRRVAPENWYQMLVVAHVQLKQWKHAVKAQKRLLSHYSKKAANWRQLVSLHIQAKDTRSALADQRMGYERGILRKGSDHKLLAQMMLQRGIPYYAARVLQDGIDRGALKANVSNLRLLSRSWLQAKESKQALKVLARLNRVAPTYSSLNQMAQMQVELEKWSDAHKTLLRALKFGKGNQGRVQLMLGIVRIKLERFDEARQALSLASEDKRYASPAKSWLSFLKQIEPQV